MKYNKKAQAINLRSISAFFVLFVVAGLIGTYGVDIAEGVGDDFAADDTRGNCDTSQSSNCTLAGFNLTSNVISAHTNLAGQFGNVGTVLGAALIITILAGAFMFLMKGNVRMQ